MSIQTYVALLRGINVGGHHKVPMKQLSEEFKKEGYSNITTILNSGNIIFDGPAAAVTKHEEKLNLHLEKVFGFQIPVLIRTGAEIVSLLNANPFDGIVVTKDIRLYVSFLKEKTSKKLSLPWFSNDKSFQIIDIRGNIIISTLDLSIANTPKGMDALEDLFGKNITTRNWNTIIKISAKLK